MIAINGIPLNQVEKDNIFKVIYLDAVELLKKTQQAYTLKFVPALMTRKDPADPTSRDEYPTGINFRSTRRYVCDQGECEFTYYITSRVIRGGGYEFIPRHLDFSKVETIDTKKDIDKAFFMIMVSTVCQIDPRFKKFQNGLRNPNSQYYIEDVAADAKAKMEYEKLVTKVRNAFYDPERMLSDEAIISVCKEYKIPVTETSTPEELRTYVAGSVMRIKPDMAYNVEELKKFEAMMDAYVESSVKVDAAIVEKAVAAKIIVKEDRKWFLHLEGDAPLLIASIEFGGTHMDHLLKGLGRNQEIYDKVLNLVNAL
jgi:hypothetical protein